MSAPENYDSNTPIKRRANRANIEAISIPVANVTFTAYKGQASNFNQWLGEKDYIVFGSTVFAYPLSEDIPYQICEWLTEKVDDINVDGTSKPTAQFRATYSHAQKMKSALVFAFNRLCYSSATDTQWRHTADGHWLGNPATSPIVDDYINSLRRRKARNGGAPMSSRAITKEVLEDIYKFNAEYSQWDVRQCRDWAPASHDDWGGGRARRLVRAVALLEFWCLLRGDEGLKIQRHDIIPVSPTCIEISMPFRKTAQYGDSKPYYIHLLPESLAEICPVRALCDWLSVANIADGYIFRRIVQRDQVSQENTPMTSEAFLELFRNALIDVGRDPHLYGNHSLRRGGTQFLSSEMRWSIRQICEWGGWSLDFKNPTIMKYLVSADDEEATNRKDYLDPNRAPGRGCSGCGRSCHCR